jgi:2-polyprenyl-6-methoxyphenol hydroxylase-like FAD-dependent oxidoreductase
MRALIVGGGIAGPATAMALGRVGIDAVVLEAAGSDRSAAGSWFTVAPNGLAALQAIDALDPVREIGVPTRRNVMIGATGRILGAIPLGRPLADGTPALSFKRPELAAALARQAAEWGIEVRKGIRVTGARTDGSAAEVITADGQTMSADLVIGADGIHSTVRSAIDPDAPAGRYLGLTNFGGITRQTPLATELPAESWQFVFGRRAFFGALPTPSGDVVWFANVPRAPISRAERAGTSRQDWLDRLTELAAADAGPFAELISTGELELAGDNTYDLPRVPTWHRGRMVLVGDAVHAPAPSSGQGASMALEDAVVLAASLARAEVPEAGLVGYETARRDRVQRIVAAGARTSSSKTPGPLARLVQDAVLRMVFRYLVTERSQAWIVDHRVSLPAATDPQQPFSRTPRPAAG